jgi:hypothetical protein
MGIINVVLLTLGLGTQALLLFVLYRRRVFWSYPCFFAYIAYSVAGTIVLLLVSFHYNVYFYAFWANEAALAVFAVAALHEVFRRVFFGFYAQSGWFRLLFPGVIALAFLAVLWAAHHRPPLPGSSLRSAILLFGIAVNLIQAGIFSLFLTIARTFRLRWRFAPLGIILGFTVAAVGSIADYWAISEFGTKIEIFTKYIPPVAYILAVVVWLDTFLRPEPGAGTVSAATLNQVAEAIRRDTAAMKRFLEKIE